MQSLGIYGLCVRLQPRQSTDQALKPLIPSNETFESNVQISSDLQMNNLPWSTSDLSHSESLPLLECSPKVTQRHKWFCRSFLLPISSELSNYSESESQIINCKKPCQENT